MKERLDVLMTGRGLAESREKAKALIMAGLVYVDGQREDKAGQNFPSEVTIEVRGNRLPYVSRGGLKLEKALKEFPLSLAGKICMGCRRIDRRFHGLHVAARGREGLCGRMWATVSSTGS